ncbi:MAG TPA: hypothetical protein VNL15_06935 [Dehalococcoidia bacterium]|nr:hypothetical protein [Dehalococcoidia bacterium]
MDEYDPDEDKAWAGLEAAINSPKIMYSGGTRQSKNKFLGGYRREVLQLCENWGLRCAWGPPLIHATYLKWADFANLEWRLQILPRDLQELLRGYFRPIRGLLDLERLSDEEVETLARDFLVPIPVWWRTYLDNPPAEDADVILRWAFWQRHNFVIERDHPGLADLGDLSLKVEVPVFIADTWGTAKERLLVAARESWDAVANDLLQRGAIVKDTESKLKEHLRWLYLRICPQPDIGRPWGWQMIANNEDKESVNTVQKAVTRLSKELGISLPKLPPGPARVLSNLANS